MAMLDTTRLDEYIRDNRLIRHQWTGTDSQGRETACLLAALVPQCGATSSWRACPVDAMPAWLASLTPWMDDSGSEAAWSEMVTRYARIAARWGALDSDAWRRAFNLCLIAIVGEAMRHVDADVFAVCRAVQAALPVGGSALGAAEAEAEAWAARTAAGAAAWAAGAAAWAAGAEAAAAAAAAADRITVSILDAIEAEIITASA